MLNQHAAYLTAAVALLEEALMPEWQSAYRAIVAVLTTQWRFRAQQQLYTKLGPRILHLPGWSSNYYGSLLCSDQTRSAPWFVVPDNVAPSDVVQLIVKHWQIKRPECVPY